MLAACHAAPEANTETTAPVCPPVPAPFTIQHPAWADHASLYQVNVRQYTREGTFRAFETHLARLDSMGVDVLWLMPVQPIGLKKRKGNLGSQYSVRDYRAVNPEFGTLADLKHLVEAAHQRKMHVILDWVANHTAWDNALVQQHPDWFTHDAHGALVAPVADWQDVVDLDYSKPALRQYMTESMAWWVKEADVDGFRCDVAGLVPTDFWNDTRAALARRKPVFLLAEWDELHRPPFVPKGAFTPHTHLLEKAFDATYALRLHYLLDSIAQEKKPTAALLAYFAAERRMYPVGVALMNFTSSHDVNSWDGTEYERLGKNAVPMAVVAALLPGIPLVYSGQEAGLRRRLKFFDKDTIGWHRRPLHGFYTKLLHLKKTHPALANFDACGKFRLNKSPKGTLSFVRQHDEATVLVVANLTDDNQAVDLPAVRTPYEDVFQPKAHEFVGHRHLYLKPHTYRVLQSGE